MNLEAGQTCFGIIQNNIALKQPVLIICGLLSFGIIQNNIALKPDATCMFGL